MSYSQTDRTLNFGFILASSLALFVLLLTLIVTIDPNLELSVSQLFYRPGFHFIYASHPIPVVLHTLALVGGWGMGFILAIVSGISLATKKLILNLPTKDWLFLFLALILGPVLVANIILKDNWGRARPREIVQFGGQHVYTRPLVMAHECDHNCSFVSGDGAFGFYLTVFAYVAPRRQSRKWVWAGYAIGSSFGLARIIMGAHFLSDVLYSCFFMSAIFAGLYALIYKGKITKHLWAYWFYLTPYPPPR